MVLKDLFNKYKNHIIIIALISIILLTLSFLRTFSDPTSSTDWDGVVARDFTSGTGTEENPYVIKDASEFAYFKSLLEGEDASAYANKNYVITGGFNYGGYDISINNTIPFSGTIDGRGNLIYNATISNSLFNSIEEASIKNLNFNSISYIINADTGGLLANSIIDSNISMLIVSGSVHVNSNSSFGGLVYTSENNSYRSIILNYDINSESDNTYAFAYSTTNDEGTNILIKDSDYDNTNSATDLVFNSFDRVDNKINVSNYELDNYKISVSDNTFIIEYEEPQEEIIPEPSNEPKRGGAKGPVSGSTITEHATGRDGTTLYINDLIADYNYMKGLNFAEIRNTNIPSGTSTGYYDDANLVKVEIIYDGADINNSSLVGAVSPLNNETTNKYIYFKYYALERNSNGSLATNSDGDNYIRIELIDNPFSKRPYTTSGNTTTEYGFNGWVCNQGSDTSTGLCENSTFSFRKSDYTRYLDIPVNGGSELIVHLNATWYKASVITSSGNLNNFNTMSMQPTFTITNTQVQHRANAFWNQNYTQMVYSTSYNYNAGYLPVGVWYRTNRNSGTYNYVSRANSVRADRWYGNTTLYVFNANTNAIVEGTQYTGGSVTFVASFNPTGSNTDTTITTYDDTYMNFVEDPNGTYTYTEQVPTYNSQLSANMNVEGFYYKVDNPTSTMINTGEYYSSTGVKCTSTSGCNPAYKLIQYNDSVTNSNNNSIYLTESSNGSIVDAGNYYYLVTRDLNIFRYTSSSGNGNNQGLSISSLNSDRPFTLTGTAVNGTSAAGILNTYNSNLTVGADLVIENIRVYGPNSAGTNNTELGNNSRTSYSLYANGHNLKIGRNIVSSRNTSYLAAYTIMGGTNSAGPSGTFRVIVESGFYYAYHSGAMSGSSNYTLNETTIIGSDYDRATNTHNKLRLLIGIDGYAGGHHTAGSDSLFASFTIVKSGRLGYNSNDTANSDNTAGMYIGGRSSKCVESITGAKIEGGIINTVVGGYGYNGSSTTNSTYIGMSGGTVREIYGGAGHSTTVGNRIINATGGTVTFSILGGSDSNGTTDTDDGVVEGSTLIYVGGNIVVGDGSNNTLNGVETGSVFGAGGGREGDSYTAKGTVYNSHVIINGGTINRSVYGGGNFGSTGTQSTTSASTVIDIYSGTINSVYGGSKSSGFSKSNYENSSTIDINIMGGTIGNVYGGSNTKGTIYGSVDIEVTGGTITGNVYGGGQGSPTVVSNNVDITIGNSNSGPTINGSVYGGSALGTVNSANKGSVDITVANGTIGNVYGGGEGSANVAASVLGDVTVGVTGGTIGNVYGGADTSGTVSGDVSVTVSSGSITTNVYGGGKGASTYANKDVDVVIGTANVANTPTIGGSVYGGSAFGTVNSQNDGDVTVTVNNGIITGSVFGGGQGNSSVTPVIEPQVLGTITVDINGGDITNVFGGHDQAGTHSKQNEVHLDGGIVGSAYGGGNSSSVTNTNIYLNGATITTLYGGSNTLGTVSTTNVDITSGTVQTVYGGNNVGGTCGTTDVTVQGTATINGSIYGGGNQVATTTTNVTLISATGTIPNVYGGGNAASVTTANVTQNGTTVTTLFGGSNSSGTVTDSYITHTSGTTTTIYGGNNAGGTTTTTHIEYNGGTTTSIYGGGNQAASTTSNIEVNGGTITDVFGGGNRAGLTTSNISITEGSITNVYGGSDNTGVVTTTNIEIDDTTNTISNVYGGGNRAGVGTTNVTINDGTFGNVYGGGNLAQVTGNTNVDINGGTINVNLYGGGNYGVVEGSSYVYITDTTILGSAYAGGNGETAILEGNTNITIDGNTVIGTNNSVAPTSGCVFGGGNRAETGIEEDNDSTSSVNIVGGTFYGNVYGGANTSVIYGSTIVNIGANAYTSQTLQKHNIYIKGHVFGGGEANASGSEIYDWNFISVTEGTHINVDGNGFNDVTIGGSFFGGGNASSASGDSYLSINNYGTMGSPKQNVSIQRAKYVTINNSSILLKGAIDRANDYDKELFAISRVDVLTVKNNSEMYFVTGANLLKRFESVDANGTPASVTINENTNQVSRTVNNRIYMYEGKNLNIAKDQQVTDYGEVVGMTFFGIFNYDNDHNVNTGIYNRTYSAGDTLPWAGTFSRGSYVLGLHETNHNIQVNGFYSNFINEDTAVNEVKYIEPTPDNARFYMWFIGENVIEYNVNLVASKYSTLGSQEASFLEFSKPNTSFQILSFDSSEIASGISLVDKSSIPRIAANASDANNIFGLSMEASNSGWLTTGRTSFYTREPSISGVTYYEGENTNTVPTMLFYLYHSKNLTEEKDLGTVRISVMAITKINALSNEVERLVINVNMSTALFQTTEYEGAMTPGDKYELFASTATNITTKSKFSAYYGLYAANSNAYQTGYHRVLSSSYVLPVGTKITMLDFNQGSSEYYYHVISQADYTAAQTEFGLEGECSYPLSLFTRMGSKSNNSNYNDAAKNLEYYDGTNSSEEFIFIVDFGDTSISQNELNHTLLLEIRDANEESIITVLGIQHSQMTYNLYYGLDAQIDPTVTPSANPLYIGYTDIFTTTINYRTSALNGADIIDTQYFDNKLGAQIYILNSDNNVVSGTDLTGTYFTVDNVRYYPDISGYTHIKLSDKVGNIQKWIIFNTENSSLATGSYTFVIEFFASPDGIYYSRGNPVTRNIPINIISTTYGLRPTISDDSTILRSVNDKDLEFTVDYTSRLNNPSLRIAMYRRRYDQVYDTNYDLVDFQDFIDMELVETNHYEYVLTDSPNATNSFDLPMVENLTTGTYRLVFRLYDNNTKIGEIVRYIIVK